MATVRGHLAESLQALRAAFANPGIRRIELAYTGSAFGLFANAVAVAVYAFHHGGATAVGLFGFARLGAASLAAPFAATLADRHRQERVMLASDLARVATVAGTAAAAALGIPALVYLLAAATSVISTAFRPAEAALLPALATTPEELTAANVSSSALDSVGAFAGPAAGALLLSLDGPTAAFAAVAATYLWSASFVARIPPPERPTAQAEAQPPERGTVEPAETGIVGGLRAVRREPRLQLLLSLYGAQTLVAGAYGVLIVVIALQLLGLGNAGVGLLESTTGVGAIVGALVALVLVGRRRTAGDLGLGLLLFGAPLLAIAGLPRTWMALLALGILGIGNSIVDISAVTLLQRTASPEVAGRIFGLVESLAVGGLALGSLATPLLLHLLGTRTTLLAAGVLLPMLVALTRRPLAAVDAGATVPEEQLNAIASVPFLSALPLQKQEALAAVLERVKLNAGTTLFSEGDHGDRFYALVEGTLAIDLHETVKLEHAPAFVGEIALLRDIPRTATVRAETPVTLWALEREHFLDAVVGHARSRASAESVLASRGALSAV